MDFDRLTEDLMDYYGAATFGGSPTAILDLSNVENENPHALLQRAVDNGFDLNKYKDDHLW